MSIVRAALLGAALGATGCLKAWDPIAPAERATATSAFVEQPGVVRIDAGIGGGGTDEIGLELGVRVGLPGRLQVGMNLAHVGVAILNGHLEWNVVDKQRWGIGTGVLVMYLDDDLLWYAPSGWQGWLADMVELKVSALTVPMHVTFTGAVSDKVLVDVSVIGQWSKATVDTHQGALVTAMLGTRGVSLRTSGRAMVGDKLSLGLEVKVPVALYNQISSESEVVASPGVHVGVRTARWRRQSLDEGLSVGGSAQVQAGEHTRLTFGLLSAALYRRVGVPVNPYISAYWRL